MVIKEGLDRLNGGHEWLEPTGNHGIPIQMDPTTSLISVWSGRLHDVRTSLTSDLKIVSLLKPEPPDPLFDHESIIG